MLSSFLKPGKAYKKAGDELRRAYGESQQYQQQAQQQLQPFAQQGQAAYGDLSGAMRQLLDPQALESQWAQGYETSPYARMLQEQSKNQGLDAASSMGLMGSTPALRAIQQGQAMITAQDRENYLNRLTQKYLSGAELAQGIYGTGAGAAGQMGQNYMQQAQNALQQGQGLAQMKYGEQAAPGSLLGKILGGVGGFALGGPIGSALANRFIGSTGPIGLGGGRPQVPWGAGV